MNDNIDGGAFQIARKIFDSELWLDKPSSWKVIWIYILGRVSHKKTQNLERGEGFFQWTKELSHIGGDISHDMIKKSSIYFRRMGMIDTRRSTRGVFIKVLNYNKYQTFDNYTSTSVSTKKALEKHQRSTTINKNVKNEKKETHSEVPSQDVVDIISSFKEVNPSYQQWYKNKSQRAAIERMLSVHGKDRLSAVIAFLPKSNTIPFVPIITSPFVLESKWADLQAGLLKLKNKQQINQPNVII